jgi:hypothetical protein
MPRPIDPLDEDGEFAEMRSAPRFSLMLRAAKLLSPSGEYVCIVRDVSETGAKLKLFHPMPPEAYFLLELSNGDRFPMEMVWQEGGHGGFRFVGHVDVHTLIDEPSAWPRRQIRLKIESPALITIDGVDGAALLINLSQQGACIETGKQLAERQRLYLEIPGIPVQIGHVRWRKGFTHGIVFQEGFRLDDFARYAFMLQPFETGPALDKPRVKTAIRFA